MDIVFETIREFSQRVNLPEQLIRCLVKQGKLPHIKPKSCWVKIHVQSALLALDTTSATTAEELAAKMPVPIKIMPKREKKHHGRLPDKVRLAKKAEKEAARQCNAKTVMVQ